MNSTAPICLFCYNRKSNLIKTLVHLRANPGIENTIVYIFSDGWKGDLDRDSVVEVRRYLDEIETQFNCEVIVSESNKGLARSIIDGVNYVLEKNEKVIVLEDDLITSPNFLGFMNQALDVYETVPLLFSVSGYTMTLPSLATYSQDVYFGYRSSSWGWGTWKDRWDSVDWEVKDYEDFRKSRNLKRLFQRGGADTSRMLRKQMKGRIDSWAIRFCYSQYKNGGLTVFPSVSKVQSIGIGKSATHTKKTTRFETELDSGNKREFSFPATPVVDAKLASEFRWKFSSVRRAIDRLGL